MKILIIIWLSIGVLLTAVMFYREFFRGATLMYHIAVLDIIFAVGLIFFWPALLVFEWLAWTRTLPSRGSIKGPWYVVIFGTISRQIGKILYYNVFRARL